MTAAIRIRSLHVYPVKSGRGINLSRAQLGTRGLQDDRHWMVADENGRFLTQRTHPTLARLHAQPTIEALELTHPAAGSIVVPRLDPFASLAVPRVTAQVWKRSMQALDCGDAAAHFVSRVLERPARLLAADQDSFPDGFPLLVCSTSSLQDLTERLGAELPMNRFRPNVVIDGLPPWAEDRLLGLRIGQIVLRMAKPCTRCVITSRDQDSGDIGVDPLPTLRRFRFDAQWGGVTFGQNARVDVGVGAWLSIGDTVEPLWRELSQSESAPAR